MKYTLQGCAYDFSTYANICVKKKRSILRPSASSRYKPIRPSFIVRTKIKIFLMKSESVQTLHRQQHKLKCSKYIGNTVHQWLNFSFATLREYFFAQRKKQKKNSSPPSYVFSHFGVFDIIHMVLFQAYVSVSHCGIRPFCVFLEALLHYASPNWLADVTLCLGVASPPSV